MKVSFDFDGTLDRKVVQDYAKELIIKGCDVWICTARFSPQNAPNPNWNDDLFQVCDSVGINKNNVIFCEMSDKYKILKDNGFIFHLDDDWEELKLINKHTNIKGISVFGTTLWKNKCNNALQHIK